MCFSVFTNKYNMVPGFLLGTYRTDKHSFGNSEKSQIKYYDGGGANDLDLESFKKRYFIYVSKIKNYKWDKDHYPDLEDFY